jgi:molybdate transport system substrate-binding protein
MALLSSCRTAPSSLRIAAAADLRYAMDDLVATFHKHHSGIRVEPSYGSSGTFYQQLVNRAPFDLYLSADVDYPRRLAAQGLIVPGSEFRYAVGRIVVWTDGLSGIDVAHLHMDALRSPAVHHIAIANPAHAPYGRAAEAALRNMGVYDAVKDKLVMGENISQAFQLAQSGAAEVGIVALSLARAPAAAKGSYWEVPLDAYPRILQGGAILPWSKNREAAEMFRAFLLSAEGRAILKRYGFAGE